MINDMSFPENKKWAELKPTLNTREDCHKDEKTGEFVFTNGKREYRVVLDGVWVCSVWLKDTKVKETN
jgi:hypothetical protein